VENLTSSQKLNLMIKFMSTVYDFGLRGDQITVLMRVKQSLLLRVVGDQQAIKACRLTNQNLKRILNFTHQDGKSSEDHCIRNGHITFKWNGKSLEQSGCYLLSGSILSDSKGGSQVSPCFDSATYAG
jgi:hypothetical protein